MLWSRFFKQIAYFNVKCHYVEERKVTSKCLYTDVNGRLLTLTLNKFYQASRWAHFLPFGIWALWCSISKYRGVYCPMAGPEGFVCCQVFFYVWLGRCISILFYIWYMCFVKLLNFLLRFWSACINGLWIVPLPPTMVVINVQDWSPHMGVILKGSQISAFQLKGP